MSESLHDMTVQTVVQDVCAFIGVKPPDGSIFTTPNQDRTMWEFVRLADEMAQRIAYDTRDWQVLRKLCTLEGAWLPPTPPALPQTQLQQSYALPSDYQRMLKSMSVYRSSQPTMPMTFISDPDEWLQKELNGFTDTYGRWTIFNNEMHIRPALTAFRAEDLNVDPPITG